MDVVIDATGDPAAGLRHARLALGIEGNALAIVPLAGEPAKGSKVK